MFVEPRGSGDNPYGCAVDYQKLMINFPEHTSKVCHLLATFEGKGPRQIPAIHTSMLTHWDFSDEAASSTQQINRQKSARNLDILRFDPSEPRAVFCDPKRDNRQTATLAKCDCNDFNLAGLSPRKTFKPCIHIYRLAIKLALIEPKYLDHRARFALAALSPETQRLQRQPFDPTQWSRWATEVHSSGVQQNRQYRAYSIIYDEREVVREVESRWTIHKYSVTLDACECMDFRERMLPCKHIYAVTLASKIALSLTQPSMKLPKSEESRSYLSFLQAAKQTVAVDDLACQLRVANPLFDSQANHC